MSTTEQTAELARRYFKAWTGANREGVANALAERLVRRTVVVDAAAFRAFLGM